MEKLSDGHILLDFIDMMKENGICMCVDCIYFDKREFKIENAGIIGGDPKIKLTINQAKNNYGICRASTPNPTGGWAAIPDGTVTWCGKFKTTRKV